MAGQPIEFTSGAIVRGIGQAIASGAVTYDLARQMPGAREVPTSGFAEAIIHHLSWDGAA